MTDRTTHIGASEVSNLFGYGYRSEYELWLEKLGELDPWEGNDATALGTALEPLILDRAESELGPLDRQVQIVAPSCQVLRATIDGVVRDSWEVVEAKTAGIVRGFADRELWGPAESDEVPPGYLFQVHAEMLCSGASAAWIYALLGGRGHVRYRIERCEDLCQTIATRCAEWWQKHIVDREPPSMVPAPPMEVLKRIRRQLGSVCELPEAAEQLVAVIPELKRRKRMAEHEVEAATSSLVAMLGTCESGVLPNGATVSYMQYPRRGYTVKPTTYRMLKLPELL